MVSSNLIITQTGLSSQPKIRQNRNVAQPLVAPLRTREYFTAPLNAHKSYAQINFRSAMALHKSWGAAVDTAKNVNFKVFTWPDVKKVYVQLADNVGKKARCYDAEDLGIVYSEGGGINHITTAIKNCKFIELEHKGEGVFEHKVGPGVAKHGQDYRFVILKKDNTLETVKDPYSMHQPDILGWSKIYDHNKYTWHDQNWTGNKVKEKISREHYVNGLKNPYTISIYKMQVATATKEGTFEAAKKQVKKAKKLGFDAVELMPIGNTHSFNGGYDEVDKFSPQESFLGGPDKLKELIDYAHSLKLNMIADVVPNHMGPDGSFLSARDDKGNFVAKTGPYLKPFSGKEGEGFGDVFDYEGAGGKYVREYMANDCLNLLENYHFDGLRFDMTKPYYTGSDFTLKKMIMEINYHKPDAFCDAEDGENNRENLTKSLSDWEANIIRRDKNSNGKVTNIVRGSEQDHIDRINWLDEKIFKNDTSILGNLGFDSEWDFPYQKQIAAALLGNWENINKNLHNLNAATTGSQHRTKYFASHDNIWNVDGTVFIDKFTEKYSWLSGKINGKNECQKGQRAAHASHWFDVAVATGWADRCTDKEWEHFNFLNHMREHISKNQAKESLERSYSLNKLGLGDVFSTKGIKMVVQRTEDADLTYLKQAREFSNDKEPQNRRMLRLQSLGRGYIVGKPALKSSQVGSIDYSSQYKEKMRRHAQLTWKLNKMIHEIPALNDGDIITGPVHDASSVSTIHRKKGNDSEVYIVKNFNGVGYNGDYGISFPAGNKWVEILNSDSKRYGGSGKFENTQKIDANNNPKIAIAPYSFIIFEKKS